MDFQENFVQSVWKYQYFDQKSLATTSGDPLSIRKIGYHNYHEGPDFTESQIEIGPLTYHGSVEVHLRSSDWIQHSHADDPRYESVILHVVWQHDREIVRRDGTVIPTLELRGKVFLDVLRNYQRLISTKDPILCGRDLGGVKEIIKFSMLEKALVERFQEKSRLIREQLEQTGGDWEETAYRWLFYCFGFKINSQAMLKVAQQLPYKLLKKHVGQPIVQEALLMGQAGLLEDEPKDDYTAFLKKEYAFYQRKYGFKNPLPSSLWKFMRVRPYNYPTVRLAQLAAVLSQSPHLFSELLHHVVQVADLKKLFAAKPSSYWETHQGLGRESKKRHQRGLTLNTVHLLGINFIVPLWYAYGQYADDLRWQEKCFDFLQRIPAEQNYIIRGYQHAGWNASHAMDSQGMIGLHHHYCSQKKCLDCKVGQQILRSRPS